MATNLMIFSDDMIDEILSRLPPKSLLRFRCLSRSMCSKIDSEKFTKLHLNHSLKSDPSETLIISGYGHVRLVEHRLTTPKVRRLTLPVDPTGSNVRICGSCNGLVALHIDKPGAGDVVVWNPFTDKHKMLPAPGIRPMWPKALGFGYDPLTRDYKQVRIDYEGNYLPYVAQFRVFSFRSNTWRKVNGPPFRVSINIDRRYGVSFSGALHFAIATSDQPDGDSIMAFDLHTENFRVLTGLPRYGVDGSFQDVQVLRGQLCVIFGLANTSEIEAWAMTDYGREEESWTMLLRVSLSSSLFGELSCLLDYSENPRKFLVHGRFSGPVWVDSERKTEEVVTQLRIWPRAWDATSMAGTLVSVDGGPVWVDSERKTTEEVVMQLWTWPYAWDATSMAGTLVSVDGFLGIPAEADMEEIKAAYRKLSKAYHPDTTSLPLKTASEKFMRLREIYDVQSYQEKCKFYEWTLAQEVASRQAEKMMLKFEDPYQQEVRNYKPKSTWSIV